MARGPAEVLVAVGVEFCQVRQSCSLKCALRPRSSGHIPLYLQWASHRCSTGIVSWLIGLVAQVFEVVGWGGIMYRSISGGPGQGPGLVNWLVTGLFLALQAIGIQRLTLAGASHDCDGTRSVDTAPFLS